ncbi:MAG: hypothetical protein M5U28_36450 [Sandaracinaceae bacterium]|nr:hypothetical protein [Sandaracinaceae bacterium]
MRPALFRGIGVARAAVRVASLVTLYVGGFAVLWGLGLVVRGWQGWTILGAPLAALVTLRLWAWRRVSVEVTEDRVRYEGAVPARDWEIPLERVEAVYFDRALPRQPARPRGGGRRARLRRPLRPGRARALRSPHRARRPRAARERRLTPRFFAVRGGVQLEERHGVAPERGAH